MSAKSKLRLDQLLVERGFAASKAKAQALIMAGSVMIGDKIITKAGRLTDPAAKVALVSASPYVSRGGEKLASVAKSLGLDFTGKTVLDVGTSTGGFCDYALQHGAKQVIAVDVGTGQLDWRLRNDPRVEVHEQTDIRSFEADFKVDIALVDVSFVSVLKVIEAVANQAKPGGQIVVMVKPQFEAGKVLADKFAGVISDETVRQEIIGRVRTELSRNYEIGAAADSTVLGPKGNREHFMVLVKR